MNSAAKQTKSAPTENCICAAKRLHARSQEKRPGSAYRFAHHPTCPDAKAATAPTTR